MMPKITSSKTAELLAQFSRQARDAHRRGDVVIRAQAEESIREVASRATAKTILAKLYV